MRTYEQRLNYARLELIPYTEVKRRSNVAAILSALRAIGQWVLEVVSPSSEPRIREVVDRHGLVWWQVYDPITRQQVWLISEAEVMTWLENRYYGKDRW